jgi:hypothetical protein
VCLHREVTIPPIQAVDKTESVGVCLATAPQVNGDQA